MALGIYGIPLTIIGATLAYCSPHYRQWLTAQWGYKQRLAKFPGLSSTSPRTLAIVTLIYLLLVSVLALGLSVGAFAEATNFLTSALVGFVGLWFLYGWFIKGWRLTPPQEPIEPVKFSPRAIFNDVKGNRVGLGLLTFAVSLPGLCCVGVFAQAALNQPLREVGLLPTFTATPTSTYTPMPTATFTSTPIATKTPRPTATPLPTDTPIPTNTPVSTDTPVPTATPSIPFVTSENAVNLRGGPGTDYQIVGTLPINQNFEITGRNADASWWQISVDNEPVWVAASVVNAANLDQEIEVVEAPPPPTPTTAPTSTVVIPTSTPILFPTFTPAPFSPAPPAPGGGGGCCRVCTTGKACGDSCISANKTCHKGPGCACNG